MVYRSLVSLEKESDYKRAIFPDFQYYSLRVEQNGLHSFQWTVDNQPRGIEFVAFVANNGKHHTYFKLFGIKDAFPANYLFETLEDAYAEAEARNNLTLGSTWVLKPGENTAP